MDPQSSFVLDFSASRIIYHHILPSPLGRMGSAASAVDFGSSTDFFMIRVNKNNFRNYTKNIYTE